MNAGTEPASKGCKDKTQTSGWPGSSFNITEGSSCCFRNWPDFKPCLPNFALSIAANSRAGKALVIIHPQTYMQLTDILHLELNQQSQLGRKRSQDWALTLPAGFQPLTKTRMIPSCRKVPTPSNHPAHNKCEGCSKKQRHSSPAPGYRAACLGVQSGILLPLKKTTCKTQPSHVSIRIYQRSIPLYPNEQALSRAILPFVTELEF